MPRLAWLVVGIAATAGGQPTAGAIEIFGLRKTPIEKVRKALGVKAGDPLPRSKGEMEEKLEAIDGIAQARLEAYCCDQGKPVLYVGVLERGGPILATKPYPSKEISLPQEIQDAYADFTSALGRASRDNDLSEDLSEGHSLMQNLACLVAQKRFLGLAALNTGTLRDVLANSEDPEQRAIAAHVLGYAADKAMAAGELQSALQDPDGAVRANAAGALRAIVFHAMRNPEAEIRVQPTWFVEMLNSIELSDRLEAARSLLLYTEKADENTIRNIKERAIPALMEMARWQYLPHALPAYLVLGRVAGFTDEQLQESWTKGEREKQIEEIRRKLGKR